MVFLNAEMIKGGNRYRWCKTFNNKFQNSSLKKELLKITKDVEKKALKDKILIKAIIKQNILEDDLTIIGLGK